MFLILITSQIINFRMSKDVYGVECLISVVVKH